MKPLMVLGCTSDAGKSLLVTALCRWFARHGVRVAPFKAQNMSNNARIVALSDGAAAHGARSQGTGSPGAEPPGTGESGTDEIVGGEIGVAQWLQAAAAGVEPDVRMNPVLLKPESDTRSQVVVRGVVDRELTNTPWRDRHDALWTPMAESFDSLADEFDLVVIEGAGSPAEINLRDQVNNRMIEYADASGLLVSDIDRGGSFAHLYGTWALVPESTRTRLNGFVLNRFRGDAALLAPGPSFLTDRTSMACAGVMPMLAHDLPREEGAPETSSAPAGSPTVVIPRLPYGSNLDEFHLLARAADVRWVTSPDPFAHLDPQRDAVVLPGSKHVVADLAWLRSTGLAPAIVEAAGRGVRVVGVCGGAMMLGDRVDDPLGIEGGVPGRHEGLGLLATSTTMSSTKRTVAREVSFDELPRPWSALSGFRVTGYEIRYGQWSGETAAMVDGNVLATMVHGLFEHPTLIDAMLGVSVEPVLEPTFELLADAVENHLDTALLSSLVGQL